MDPADKIKSHLKREYERRAKVEAFIPDNAIACGEPVAIEDAPTSQYPGTCNFDELK